MRICILILTVIGLGACQTASASQDEAIPSAVEMEQIMDLWNDLFFWRQTASGATICDLRISRKKGRDFDARYAARIRTVRAEIDRRFGSEAKALEKRSIASMPCPEDNNVSGVTEFETALTELERVLVIEPTRKQ